MTDIAALSTALDETYVVFREAKQAVEKAALAYIKALVLKAYPTATYVLLNDSDQEGGTYAFSAICDANDKVLAESDDDVAVDFWRPISDLQFAYKEYRIDLKDIS